ncbi:MAG: glycosyltransferase [Victivallales bacterium]|jgi:glycosyltransferase involved in cell wall biosynthesis|nr:glycosyltransferase [Victivallales bacterium]
MKSKTSKVALLHYWLLTMRGGERVFAELCDMFPDADVYTHACNRKRIAPAIKSHAIKESFISRLPGAKRACQCYLPLMPMAQKKWDFSEYPLIISSESGPIKGIRKPKESFHICYCHTPMRYLWDMYDGYFRKASFSGKAAMRLFRDSLRSYDLKSAETVDVFVANSRFVAERIKRIYNRDSEVIYPPVNTDFFGDAPVRERNYFLLAGQLIGYKRPELVVRAFSRLSDRLIVAGAGEELAKLQSIATNNVEFVISPDDDQLRELYAGAKALIFPGVEDFGMIPVEAQAARCPVIAFKAGGVLESVEPGQTGIFFENPTERALLEAIEEFQRQKFSEDALKKSAERFSRAKFRSEMERVIAATIG